MPGCTAAIGRTFDEPYPYSATAAAVAFAWTASSNEATIRYPPSRSAVSRWAGVAPNAGCRCHHETR